MYICMEMLHKIVIQTKRTIMSLGHNVIAIEITNAHILWFRSSSLEIYPSDMVTHVCKAICINILFVVTFIMAKAGKKPQNLHSYSCTHTRNIYSLLTSVRHCAKWYSPIHLYMYLCVHIYTYRNRHRDLWISSLDDCSFHFHLDSLI